MRLFPETATKRPTRLSDTVKPKILKQLADLLGSWHESLRDHEVCEYVYNNYMYEHNGFEIAKALDDKFYVSPDASLVEILEEVWYLGYRAIEEAQAYWILSEQIDPKYNINDQVKVKKDNKIYNATIRSVDNKTGKYTVNIPDLGHVPEGQLGTQGIVLNWEDIDNLDISEI
jgi:hypothetical protein